MLTHTEQRGGKRQFERYAGKPRRNDRRARIAAKNGFLIDGLTVKTL